MMICKKCGTENADNASVCAKCGNPLKAVSKPKSNLFDFSLCSGLIVVFSVLALIFLILPSTRSVSYSEYEEKMVKLDTDTSVKVLKIVSDDITIKNEKQKIDAFLVQYDPLNDEKVRLEKLEEPTEEESKRLDELKKQLDELTSNIDGLVWKQSWSADEAIAILSDPNNPDVSRNDAYIAEVKQLDETLKASQDAAKVEAQDKLEKRIIEIMDTQDEDFVNRGAIGGVLREHRDMKDVTNTVIAVMAVLLAASLAITILSWVTRLYRVRIISTIANAVLAFLSFIIPTAVWTMETKWPFEVSNYVTYGISFGSTFVWVLIFSIATLFTSLAYFADDLFGKKN